MNILYISSACSENTFREFAKTMKKQEKVYGMPVAANKFHNLVMKGIFENDVKIEAISGRPISKLTHDKLWWKSYHDISNCGVGFYYLPFINFSVFKHIFIGIACFFKICKWQIINRGEEKLVIYDASYVTVIPFIILACYIWKNKKLAIFMDVYNYMADTEAENRVSGRITSIVRKIMRFCYNKTDKYVFLSEKMNELMNENSKPYTIIEGIADSSLLNTKKNSEIKKERKVLLYAGALKEEYGLKILLEGFLLYSNPYVELHIYGDGDYISSIKEYEKLDFRIKYLGNVNNEKILKEEIKADLLINPRLTNNQFTLYSFPSKLIEYMCSGTPVITTKLPSIPNDFSNYLFFIQNETAEGICKILKEVFQNSDEQLYNFGKKTKEFILDRSNEKIQAIKILK